MARYSKGYMKTSGKKKVSKPSRGLGDVVEHVFKKTGIARIAKEVLGDDCGCEKRKNLLNKIRF